MELQANKPVICPTIIGRATELAAFHDIVREVEEGQSRIQQLLRQCSQHRDQNRKSADSLSP